jgi:hypothetical protein
MEFIDRALAATACPNCGMPYAKTVYNTAKQRIEPFILYQTVCCQSIYCTACNPYPAEANSLPGKGSSCRFCETKSLTCDTAIVTANGSQIVRLVYRGKRYGMFDLQLPHLLPLEKTKAFFLSENSFESF